MAFAIFFTGDLPRECALNSRTSAVDQDRRLWRPFLVRMHLSNKKAPTEPGLNYYLSERSARRSAMLQSERIASFLKGTRDHAPSHDVEHGDCENGQLRITRNARDRHRDHGRYDGDDDFGLDFGHR